MTFAFGIYESFLFHQKYPPIDSVLNFTEVLKKLKDFTLPSGDAALEKWITIIKNANEYFNAGDLKAVGQVGHGATVTFRKILPAIPDKIVYAALEHIADEYDKLLEDSLTSGSATLADMDKFLQWEASTMLSAMSKTKPIAATVN